MKKKRIAIAILLGLGAFVVYLALAAAIHAQGWDFPIVVGVTVVIYLTAGVVLGWVGQTVNWRMGLLISAPIIAVVLFSMLFTGIFTRFWDRDVPMTIAVLVAPLIGVLIGGRLTRSC